MKKYISALLFLTLMLGACTTETPPTQTNTGQPVPAATEAGVEEAATTAPQTESSREAVISELENDVQVRVDAGGAFVPAASGMVIQPGGGAQTGDNSRARIDLLPDGTIVRLAPNSSFTLPLVAEENGEPKTKLELLAGQVFIILNGGSLDVETPSGVASVRGSMMGVAYNPDTNNMSTTCLEGHCTVADEDEEIELTEGQAADFTDGELDDEYRDMEFEELGIWMLENPDIEEYLEEYPDLPDLPEDFNWNYDFYDDPSFDFYFDPEYDPGEQEYYFDQDPGDGGFAPTEPPTGEGFPTEPPTGPTDPPGDPTGG